MTTGVGTAEAPQGTAAIEGLTPPAEPTETRAPAATETAAPGTTETAAPQSTEQTQPVAEGEQPAGTEPEHTARGIDDLPDEEFAEHPRVKSLLARSEESQRQKDLNAAAAERTRQRQQWFDSGTYTVNLTRLAENAPVDEQGRATIDPKQAAGIADSMWEAASYGATSTVEEIIRAREPKDYRPPRETADRLEAIRADVDAGRKPLNALIDARLDAFEQTVIEQKLPQIRRDIERQVRAEVAAEQRTAAEREADVTRKTEPTPSRGTAGASAPTWTSQRQIEAAHAKDEISTDTYLQMLQDGSYHGLPW